MSEKVEVSSEELSLLVAKGMLEKKAEDVVIVDLRKIGTAVADFFVICSGNSDTHVDSISESVDKFTFQNTSTNPWHSEGKSNNEWVLLDYVDVVAHIFKKEKRDFYGLESLWGDAKIHSLEGEGTK
ncbi:MAG: ribosome silencing factor [Bacteroidota bacterium]